MPDVEMKSFASQAFCMTRLADEDFKPILDEANKIKSDFSKAVKFNESLAGSIKKEFRLFDCWDHVEKIAVAIGHGYDEYRGRTSFKHLVKGDCDLALADLWINFQERYEFNPPHLHAGIFSFVIWVDIPYLIEDEEAMFPDAVPEENYAGKLTFYTPDALGTIQRNPLSIDRRYNQWMALWPSTFLHGVSPFFSSSQHRISVAGNLKIRLNQ